MSNRTDSLLDKQYWKEAGKSFTDSRMLAFAGLIAALRVAVKFIQIPVAAGLYITFDCYVNALGSIVYGPLMGLAVGAVSDTLGAILAPSGPYFLPFILVEMLSSFLFGVFFWRKPISVPRALAARFTVNFICNIVLTSIFMKWYYYVFYGLEKAEAYAVINLVRIVKNLVLFPLEALLIAVVLRAAIPVLRRQRIVPAETGEIRLEKKHYWLVGVFFLISVALVVFYVFFLKDYVSVHNLKWF